MVMLLPVILLFRAACNVELPVMLLFKAACNGNVAI